MIYQANELFQRTDKGRLEIKHKQHGLTQSERLMLIMVDGASSYQDLRAKLKSLAQERMDRAILSLLDKGLIYELTAPIKDAIPEHIDNQEMDNFLRQDELDPVSIIAYHIEEEFGVQSDAQRLFNSTMPYGVSSVQTLPQTEFIPEYRPAQPDQSQTHSGDVDFYVPLALHNTPLKSAASSAKTSAALDDLELRLQEKRRLERQIKYAYVLMGVACVLLLAYVALRYSKAIN